MRFVAAMWGMISLLAVQPVAAQTSKDTTMQNAATKNHLANASSPYLLAHADNPVDWYEWSDEAFARAKDEDKPIFLSIGYNACHWCHVMEHESFENDSIAAFLNEHFISIKVDREERPDIDQIYMAAVMAATGSGGWPMTIFMTPDREPFFAGTYFPAEDKYGRPGFMHLIGEIHSIYTENRNDVTLSSQRMVEHLRQNAAVTIPPRAIDANVLKSAGDVLLNSFDNRFGGFGTAPKFPHGGNLSLLFRISQLTGDTGYRDAALYTLTMMAGGGMYDQLGGGFHRYSVDEQWLVPHFEKMLYDNALLVIPYLEAYQITEDDYYLSIANGILEYLQTKMADKEGAFYSTQDADSEGEEGKYYVWSKKEVEDILGDDAAWFCEYFDITEGGNFEGRNIPHIGDHSEAVRQHNSLSDAQFEAKLSEAIARLMSVREKRIPPATDDKILASWNGLAISAFAQAYQVTGRDDYRQSAKRSADFILDKMTDGDAFYHSYREGRLLKTELLEDFAYFTAGLIDLYQVTFDETYLEKAKALTTRAVERFYTDGVFFSAAADDADLIVRPRDLTDGATPSPAAVMIQVLMKLGSMTGEEYFGKVADEAMNGISGLASRAPQGVATLLMAGYYRMREPLEIVIVGSDAERLREFNRTIFSRYIPNKIVVGKTNGASSNLPLLEGRQDVGESTVFLCRNRTCRLPVTDPETLKAELAQVTGKNR